MHCRTRYCSKIEDGVVYINNSDHGNNKTAIQLQIQPIINLVAFWDFGLGIKEGGEKFDEYDYSYSLITQLWADSLKKDPLVLEIERKLRKKCLG